MLTLAISEISEDSWIQWYCSIRGHEFFCEVDYGFIEDSFNLYGLPNLQYSSEALDNILDILPDDFDEKFPPESQERLLIESTSEELYGLIHVRYILTEAGLEDMMAKYGESDFGDCPRLHCERQPMLPVALSDVIGEATVKNYCPRCRVMYNPSKEKQRHIDGAFFGKTFVNLFLMTYLMHEELGALPLHVFDYTPTIFGYTIHQSSPFWGAKLYDIDEFENSNDEKDEQGLPLAASVSEPTPPESKC